MCPLSGKALGHLSKSTFRHNAFVYDSDDDYVVRSVDFLRAGVEAGEGAIVAVPRDRLSLIREGFGRLPEEIAVLDVAASEARPARLLSAYHAALLERLSEFPAMRLLTEVECGPTSEDRKRWTGFEAALCRALSGLPVRALSAYDAIEDLEAMAHGFPPEPQPLPGLRRIPAGADPEELRERLAAELAAAGIEGGKALQMLVAANEVGVNAWRHGAAPVELRVGRPDDRFVCEIVDRGPGFDDPLAGFDPPPKRGAQAPGLWVARQLAWKLETFQAPAGFTVRLWL
jgi:anti-sigma regulatory factor (Ser/Thr protein kinase)